MQDATSAVVMSGYGGPDVLRWTTVALDPLGPEEVRIRTVAAAINHTDIKIRAGLWPIRKSPPFPYVPGVEVVGHIAAVGERVGHLKPGQPVVTMMQGLGGVRAERQGSYAAFVTVSADVVATLPPDIDLFDVAALGLGAVTAYWGLQQLGALEGRRMVITGAAGGVGSAAVGIARAFGAEVIAVVSRTSQADYARSLGAQQVIVARDSAQLALAPDSIDGALDCVAGALFGGIAGALRPHAVLSVVGAAGGNVVSFDAWQLIRPVTLTGYSTENLDGPALRAAVAAVAEWLQAGALAPPAYRTLSLASAGEGHALAEAGGGQGRLLLVP